MNVTSRFRRVPKVDDFFFSGKRRVQRLQCEFAVVREHVWVSLSQLEEDIVSRSHGDEGGFEYVILIRYKEEVSANSMKNDV